MKRQHRSVLLNRLQAARMQQQRASLIKAEMAARASTRQAVAQRSRAARLQAVSRKRLVLAQMFAFTALPASGQAPRRAQKPRSRRSRAAPSRRSQPGSLREAARKAQMAQNRAQRASAMAQRRSAPTEGTLSPPETSSPTRAKRSAHKRHVHASNTSAWALSAQRALTGALKRFSRHFRTFPGSSATQPERRRAAARDAQMAHDRAQRTSALSLKRGQRESVDLPATLQAHPPASPEPAGKALECSSEGEVNSDFSYKVLPIGINLCRNCRPCAREYRHLKLSAALLC